MTCGEGGLILTDNDEIAKKCYRLKNHGRDVKGIFKHESIGFNFSFTEMQAAIGIAQFKKLNSIINKKEEIYIRNFEELSGLKDIKMTRIPENINPVHWFTNIFINDVDHLSKFLKENSSTNLVSNSSVIRSFRSIDPNTTSLINFLKRCFGNDKFSSSLKNFPYNF